MGYFRGSEGAAFGRSLMDNVRGNPMPAGGHHDRAGVADGRPTRAAAPRRLPERPSSPRLPIYGHDDHAATMARLDRVGQSVARNSGEPEHAYSARLDMARGEAIGLARHTEETTESFGERIRHAIAPSRSAVSGRAHDLRDQAGSALGAASGAVGSFGASAQGAVQDAAAYAGGALSSGRQLGRPMQAAT